MSYLIGKLRIELGDNCAREFISDRTDLQSIDDIQKWKEEFLEYLPETYIKFGQISLAVKRIYEASYLNNEEWIDI